mgnify:CR=1 FL=1
MSQCETAPVANRALSEPFENLLRATKRPVPHPYTTGYVDHLWNLSRHTSRLILQWSPGPRLLEFGSNIGASAILFAALGANVQGVDVDAEAVELSRLNAARYEGLAGDRKSTRLNSSH